MNKDFGSRNRLSAYGIAGGLLMGIATPSHAILDFLKRDNRKITASEQASNEGAAQALLAEAQALEASSNYNKALKTYESVVRNYPRSEAAAESQFKVGEILQVDGKQKKAFEAFQKFLTEYKQSSRFAEAVQRQFNIAEDLRLNGKEGFLGGIGADIQPSKLIEFYEQISASAPRTELSAQSKLAVGAIQATQGDLAVSIVSFETVVEDYPGSKYAAEAQYNLVKLHGREASKSFSPVDLRQQREAGEDFITQFGEDPRSGEIRQALGALSDKESEKAYEVGRFYERSGDFKAAAIYYREVARHPNTKHYADASKRLSEIIATDPSIAEVAQGQRRSSEDGSDNTIPKPIIPGSSSEIALPSAPASEVKQAPPQSASTGLTLKNRPEMRTSEDDVLPIPTDNPVPGNQ